MRCVKSSLPPSPFPLAIFHWAPSQGQKSVRSSFIAVNSRGFRRFISRPVLLLKRKKQRRVGLCEGVPLARFRFLVGILAL
jgi:hypothetical protein